MSNHFYEDAQVLMYNSKYNGIKQSGGKQANLAHAVSHIAAVRVSKKPNYCSSLKRSLQKTSFKDDVPLKKIENLYHNITKKFNAKDHDAKIEGEQIGKVLEISSDILKFLMGNKKILKGLERVIRKEMKPNEDGFENNFGSEGERPGFGNGFRPDGEGPGFGDGFRPDGEGPGFGNGFGSSKPTGKPWWASSTPPPFWNSTQNWNETWWQSTSNWNSSKPWWSSSTPPPFWNSTYTWNETFWQSTSNWNSSKPWWSSSTPPPFWNSSQNWNETFWQSTFNWNYTTWESTTTTYNSSYFDNYGGTEYTDYDYNYDNNGTDYGGSADDGYDYTTSDYGGSAPADNGFDYSFDYGYDYYGEDGANTPSQINVNASADELKREFESLEENEVNDLLSSLDENTMWQLYEKLNGSDIGGKLEENLFESGYDEESDGWASVFGDTSSLMGKKRKKRQVGDFDKMDPKEMKNLASMGLQGLMIMDPEDFNLPKPLRHLRHEIPMCLKEILWESDGNSRLCAEIPDKLKEKLRDLMMMVLKQDISTNFFTLDWLSVGSSFENAKDEFEEIGKGIMSKFMVPIKVNDLIELLESVNKLYKKVVVDKAKDKESKAILMLVVDLIDVLKDDEILEEIVGLINRIRGLL